MPILSALESMDVKSIARQLRLLNDIQLENQAGSWERQEGEDQFFWSDSMFTLHQIPPSPDNLISQQDAARLIHEEDRQLSEDKRRELEETGFVEYTIRIQTADNKIKRVFAREKKLNENGAVIYCGHWQDQAREKEFQQPLIDQKDKLELQLKLFERAEEVAQAGSWQINLETFETVYSDNVYRIYGLPPQSLPAHVDSFRKYIHAEDKDVILKALEKSYVEMIPLHLEYRIIRDDDEVRYIQQVSHLVKNNRGEHILSGSTRDVTEQKLLELQLREANEILTLHNELFIQAEQIGHMGTWQVNMNTRKTVYSANLFRLYGLKPQSVLPGLQNFIQFIYPDDREIVQAAHKKAFEEHVPPELEFRIMRADGKVRTLRQKSRFIKADVDELLIGIVQDITDEQDKDRLLKESNEKLALQNEAFSQAETVSGIGSWTWNLDTNEKKYSDNIYTIYGLKPQSVPPGFESFGRYMHPEDRQWLKEMPEKINAERESMSFDYRIIRADGELRYLRSRSQPVISNGQTIIIGITQDVTAEVQMNRQLLEKIGFAELLSDTIIDRIIVTDTSNNIIAWNRSCEEFYGRKKEKVLGMNFFDALPQLRTPQIIERFKAALRGEAVHVPLMPPLAGQDAYQEVFVVPLKNEQGAVVGILHVIHDITRLQQLQDQLAGRLQFIEKLLEASIDRIMVLDNDLHFQLWNRECEKYYGLEKESIIGKSIFDVFPKFKTDPLYQHCLRALQGETVHVPANEHAGLQGYQESYFVPLKNELKKVTGVLWIMHDLTERFIAGQRLRTSETHLRAAQEIAMMGSYEMELEGDTLVWSDQTYKIFEYPIGEEITRDKLDARIHPLDIQSVHDALDKMQAGFRDPVDHYFRIITPGGKIKHLHARSQVVVNEQGMPVKVLGVVQDITARQLVEEQLQESMHFGRELADSAPDLIYVMDIVEFKVVFINNRVMELLGHDAEQVYSAGSGFFKSIMHPEDYETRMQHVTGLYTLNDNDIREIELRLKGADGSWRWFKVRGRVFRRDIDGSVWQIIGTAQDITEKKKIAEQIRKQQELLRQAEEIADVGSWELDIENDTLVWSDEIFRMYGYAPQAFEPTLEFYLETIHPQDRILLNEAMQEAMHEGATYSTTCRIFTLDGELRYINTKGRAIINASGKMCRIIGTMQDVTVQKITESELRKRNQALRNRFQEDRLIEKVRNIASWQWDVRTGKLLWTEKMFQLFGLKAYSFDATIESFIELVPAAEREQVRHSVEEMKSQPQGTLPDLEFSVMVDGSVRYFRASSRVMSAGHIVGITIDITQDALLRQQLSEKIRQLEEMNEELTSFAFVASHDLREPLRKIQIFSDWLCQKEAEKLTPEGLDRFNRIQAAVRRMETLIDDILDYSRINTSDKKFEKFNLGQVLEGVKSDLQETINETSAVIEADGLSSISGNRSQFVQLFQNLVGNSLKYRKPDVPPHIRITCSGVEGKNLEHAAANHDMHYVKIRFEDNGIGFDQQYAKKIFQMFQRLHGMHDYPGTGMGLAICKKIVEYHGGFITASGKPGEGAVFECYIPVQGQQRAHETAALAS